MSRIETVDALEALYDAVSPRSITKVARQLTPHYRRWIEASRFCVLTTVGPEGTDGSPRGDDGPVVQIADEKTLLLPDWRGNNRLDSLRNIVRDGRVSLMFMVHGETNVVRVNGRAYLSTAPELVTRFEQKTRHPRTVIVVEIGELYFQCAKAIMRSALWSADHATPVPSAGDFLNEVDADHDAQAYDARYPEYAKGRMW